MNKIVLRSVRWDRIALLFLFILILASVLAAFSIKKINWQLNLVAQSEVAQITLLANQSWRLEDAVLCVRLNDTKSGDDAQQGRCSGSKWREVAPKEQAAERYIQLSASAEEPIDVQIEIMPSGLVQMALRRPPESSKSLGIVNSSGTSNQAFNLGAQLIVSWLPTGERSNDVHEVSPPLVLPFSGALSVGRDVAWSAKSMLISGTMNIFSASKDHLAGRAVAEEISLTLGDRVEALSPGASDDTLPKGFLRINRKTDTLADHEGVINVVAFAPAEQVKVYRYGGGEYKFEASWWLRLKHQSGLIISLVLLTGLLSIISSIIGIAPAFLSLTRWCRSNSDCVK